ncbi:MAG: histidine triad nucleotide-binding protein [candidate division NC10 bacterium]|nr:histidine triad nucleotide-binding protein [candidate division NC10 bacterium]
MPECLFCRIVKGDLPSRKVYEDELTFAFDDINPKAPVHILIVPKIHLPTLVDAGPSEQELLGHLLLAANKIAKEKGIDGRGFRLVLNCNPEGGQVVYHLHIHLLGGRQMRWQPA